MNDAGALAECITYRKQLRRKMATEKEKTKVEHERLEKDMYQEKERIAVCKGMQAAAEKLEAEREKRRVRKIADREKRCTHILKRRVAKEITAEEEAKVRELSRFDSQLS